MLFVMYVSVICVIVDAWLRVGDASSIVCSVSVSVVDSLMLVLTSSVVVMFVILGVRDCES